MRDDILIWPRERGGGQIRCQSQCSASGNNLARHSAPQPNRLQLLQSSLPLPSSQNERIRQELSASRPEPRCDIWFVWKSWPLRSVSVSADGVITKSNNDPFALQSMTKSRPNVSSFSSSWRNAELQVPREFNDRTTLRLIELGQGSFQPQQPHNGTHLSCSFHSCLATYYNKIVSRIFYSIMHSNLLNYIENRMTNRRSHTPPV